MKRAIRSLIITLLLLLGAAFFGDVMAQEAADMQAMAESGESGAGWLSILPPLLAIAVALIFRQVLIALFVGIWLGVFLLSDYRLVDVVSSFFTVLTDYIVPATANPDHMSIIIFSLLIGGIVGIITDNGGTRGVISLMMRFVKTKVQGQVMTSLMGFFIFFDDYANTMVVGNTMRPLTDKLQISRAKLAYLVDSTAAPIATVALVSTWIGAMVGYIDSAAAGLPNYNESAYLVFVNSLPYNFYAFFTIFFVLLIAVTGRDFGPMLKTRINLYKASKDRSLDKYDVYKKKVESKEENLLESHWSNAAVPILVLVLGTIVGLILTGEGSTIQDIVASADSYAALLWGSMASLVTAIVMTVSQKLLNTEETLKSMTEGMHVLFDGILILVLAWALSKITVDLGTADFLVSIFTDTLDPLWMPAIIFVLSALTSFATGSSWGTMGILMPLVVPLIWSMGNTGGFEYEMIQVLIYASVSAVLAGSVWGDHCSPISDTTILSSIASQCDHVEHVNTQLPYAMIGGVLSLVASVVVLVFGFPWWLAYPIGFAIMVGIVLKFGKHPEKETYMDVDAAAGTSAVEN